MKVFHSKGTGNNNDSMLSESVLVADVLKKLDNGKYILLESSIENLPEMLVLSESAYVRGYIARLIFPKKVFTALSIKELYQNIYIKENKQFQSNEWRITISDTKDFEETQKIEKLIE